MRGSQELRDLAFSRLRRAHQQRAQRLLDKDPKARQLLQRRFPRGRGGIGGGPIQVSERHRRFAGQLDVNREFTLDKDKTQLAVGAGDRGEFGVLILAWWGLGLGLGFGCLSWRG